MRDRLSKTNRTRSISAQYIAAKQRLAAEFPGLPEEKQIMLQSLMLQFHRPDRIIALLKEYGASILTPRKDELRARRIMQLEDSLASVSNGQPDIPALLVWGESDPGKCDAWLSPTLNTSDVIIPKAGHYPWIENPDAFCGSIVKFSNTAKNADTS